MNTNDLLWMCDEAAAHLEPPIFSAPVSWLAFRRVLGPAEIRLLIEEHVALEACVASAAVLTAASDRKGIWAVATKAMETTDTMIQGLKDPEVWTRPQT